MIRSIGGLLHYLIKYKVINQLEDKSSSIKINSISMFSLNDYMFIDYVYILYIIFRIHYNHYKYFPQNYIHPV